MPPSPPAVVTPFVTLPNWVKAAARCGFNLEPVLREAGITADLVHRQNATVEPKAFPQVMAACVARSRQQHFPFVLGETFAFDYLPDLETFLATSPTLRDTLKVFEWLRALLTPVLDFAMLERGADAHLVLQIEPPQLTDPTPRYIAESAFAAVRKFARALVGDREMFRQIRFRHAPPPYAGEYEKFFGMPVQFDADEYALVFARDLLDKPLEGAFPSLHHQAGYLVEKQLHERPRKEGLATQVERAMTARPALLGQGIERVAEFLHLHPRTLQRRLADEGESWAELCDRLRFRMAAEWLEQGTDDLETISERLGFSDRRSFTRAFTRWSGLSPSAFREKAATDRE